MTCIAVKEDRHQKNIMSSIVQKKGIEEPWASERVARFINSSGYKEITLKSDTEPAISSFRNRVAENCNAEVVLEDAVKGDKPSNGFGRKRSDVVARCHQNHQVPCGELHTRRTPKIILDFAVVGGTCGEHFVQVPEGSRLVGRHLNDCMARKPTQEFVPFGEKVLARPTSSEQLNNTRYKFGVWLGVRNNSAECFVETAEGVFRAREVRRIEHQNSWDKAAIGNLIVVPWRIADGKWTVDRPATQIDTTCAV